MALNRYTIIGNLGKDAAVRSMQDGTQVISFTVAVTEKWKDKAGQPQERTDWVSCSIWRQAGQSVEIAKYLVKGMKVLVEGKPSARAYQNQAGEIAASLEVRVDKVDLLSSMLSQQQGHGAPAQQQYQQPAPQRQQPAPTQYSEPAPQSAAHDDDLPF